MDLTLTVNIIILKRLTGKDFLFLNKIRTKRAFGILNCIPRLKL